MPLYHHMLEVPIQGGQVANVTIYIDQPNSGQAQQTKNRLDAVMARIATVEQLREVAVSTIEGIDNNTPPP